MDNIKMPFLPEETLKTQRVEVYLNDLKDRLNELRMQHNEVIHNSVEIIKEIDEVSSTLLSTPSNSNGQEHITKIKKLIMEFETAKKSSSSKTTPVIFENHVDIRNILQNFEKLNDSHLLKDSLKLFRKAKESFAKIDTFLDSGVVDLKRVNISDSIRDKISMLHQNKAKDALEATPKDPMSAEYKENGNSKDFAVLRKTKDISQNHKDDFKDVDDAKYLKDAASNYASCCSSITSLNRRQSLCKNSLNGYEGDNDDSEFDMIAAKRKKNAKLNTL